METKERKKTSWVWQHFEKDPNQRNGDGEKFVRCKVEKCEDPGIKIVKGNTTVMSHHLRKAHGILPPTKGDEGESEVSDSEMYPELVIRLEK